MASEKKAVTFKDTVMTYLFEHQEVFDRVPTDGMGFALGMYRHHFTQMEVQLEDEKVTPASISGKKRAGMLKRAIARKELRHPYQKPSRTRRGWCGKRRADSDLLWAVFLTGVTAPSRPAPAKEQGHPSTLARSAAKSAVAASSSSAAAVTTTPARKSEERNWLSD